MHEDATEVRLWSIDTSVRVHDNGVKREPKEEKTAVKLDEGVAVADSNEEIMNFKRGESTRKIISTRPCLEWL